jgi:hypothetical protein
VSNSNLVSDYKKVETSSLIPYINNSRTHSDEQINQIAASIKEFGFTNPVLIGSDGGIIAGHGRVMAAKKLNLNQVPCIELAHLSEAQKKAYIIADNQLPLNAGWDLDMLRAEVEQLQELDFDLDVLGFDDGFIGSLYLDAEDDKPLGRTEERVSSGESTSMPRGGSVPVKLWRELNMLNGNVLDFGSGQDVHEFNKYDPFTNPDYSQLLKTFDVVMCNYVLNTQPSNHLIIDIVNIISKLTNDIALFAVVNDKSLAGGEACGGLEPRTSAELIDILDIFFSSVEQVESKRFNGFICRQSKHVLLEEQKHA